MKILKFVSDFIFVKISFPIQKLQYCLLLTRIKRTRTSVFRNMTVITFRFFSQKTALMFTNKMFHKIFRPYVVDRHGNFSVTISIVPKQMKIEGKWLPLEDCMA